MTHVLTNPPAPPGTGTKAMLFAQVLDGCSGVGPNARIALVGPDATGYRDALEARGFVRAVAIAGTVRFIDDRYDCVCLLDGAAERWMPGEGLAMVTERLTAGGTLVLDLSHQPGHGAGFEVRLRAAGFRGIQYRVLGPLGAGRRERPVYLLAQRDRLPSDTARAASDAAAPGTAPAMGGGVSWGRCAGVASTLRGLDGILPLDPRAFLAPRAASSALPALGTRRARATRAG